MKTTNEKNILPLISLRGVILFPHTVQTLDIGRKKSISAVLTAGKKHKILLAPQLDDKTENPKAAQLCGIATLATVKEFQSLEEDGGLSVVLEALERVRIVEYVAEAPYFLARYERVEQLNAFSTVSQAYFRSIVGFMNEHSGLFSVDSEPFELMSGEINKFVDVVAGSLVFTKTMDIYREFDTEKRLELLSQRLSSELEIVMLERKISIKVKRSIDKGQKEYFLREQMSAIQDELGEGKESNELADKINALDLPEDIREKLLKDNARNARMPISSPDYSITRNYLEFVAELPWGVRTTDNPDLRRAKEILDREHYGLEKIKDRIIEFLAVHQLTENKREPILCFVGPPGVGKTSIVRSIAQALDRKYIRMSVGGVRDEAEIRGHRKTYVGAMPGRIISGIKQAGSMNPVFLLDEIDKLCSDYRGDPASALLEVLDPEQNNSFRDNYMEIPFDLSDVVFITTANGADSIPPALLDRMEIIEMSGYTPLEKKEIAIRHLYPKQLAANGLKPEQISFADGVVEKIIECYTRESGVRLLEKKIAEIFRKVARKVVEGEAESFVVTTENLSDFLGLPRYSHSVKSNKDEIGTATGLAWTVFGGEILSVEVSVMSGKGDVVLTGQLGDVMKESARIAISYLHAHATEYEIDDSVFKTKDIHIHVPEGAIPKDGPSAGITLATAVLSALTGKGVKSSTAMTGELTLRGNVLPIGGLKEKLLAAERAGITDVVVPAENKKDVSEVPSTVREALKIVYVSDVNQVFKQSINGI